ncbi:MAG: GAF domain-containing protein [Armatimonadota bacterium]
MLLTALWARPEGDSWLRRLQGGVDPFALLDEVLEWTRKQTAAQTALLLLPAQQEIEFALVSGQGAEELRGLRLRPEETVLDELLQKRTPWRYYNAGEREQHSRGVRRGFKGLHSGIGIPLPGLSGGALVLVNQRQHEPFTDHDEALLLQIAPLFTIGVHLHALRQTLAGRERALEWLHHLAEPLSAEVSLQRVLQLVEPVLRATSPLTGGIWLYNEERTRLVCILRYGASLLPEVIEPATLPPDWQESPCTLATEQGLNAELFPLRLAGRPLGVLAIGIRSSGASGASEGQTPLANLPIPLHELIGHIALLIGHAMLHEQLACRAQYLTILYEFSLKLSEVCAVQEWLALLAENALRLVPADHCVIYFGSPASQSASQRLQPVCVKPPEDALLIHYPDAQYSLPGWVYAFNAPLAAIDLKHHPQNRKEPLPGAYQSALAVPLQAAEQAFGVILLLTKTAREFTLAEVEVLFMLANFGALRLQTLENRTYA